SMSFLFITLLHLISLLFPYTTLFRSFDLLFLFKGIQMSKTTKVEIILNHHAGNGLAISACHKVINFLEKNQISYELHKTVKDGDGVRIAKQLANHPNDSKIIVIGGDGTLNQAVNGVKESNYPNTALGYIPGGSGNDFCRGIKL